MWICIVPQRHDLIKTGCKPIRSPCAEWQGAEGTKNEVLVWAVRGHRPSRMGRDAEVQTIVSVERTYLIVTKISLRYRDGRAASNQISLASTSRSEDQIQPSASLCEDIKRVLQEIAAIFALRKADIKLKNELGDNNAQFGECQLFSDAAVASEEEWEPRALVED